MLHTRLLPLALLLAPPHATTASPPTAKPNVVLILADDLGSGDLGCHGATKVKTPHLDQLAREGVRLTDAHSPAAVCQPTRYAIMSGAYFRRAQRQGVLTLDFHEGQVTLPGLLKSAGYRTAALGKWHLGFGRSGDPDYNGDLKPGPLEIGFDSFFGTPRTHNEPPFVFVEGHRVVGLDPADPIRIIAAKDTKEGWGHGISVGGAQAHAARPVERIDSILADKAVAFLRERRAEPFLLYLAFLAPHVPIAPAPEFQGKSQAGRYGDFVQQLDACVGRVLAALEGSGAAGNTLVILTSDNGAVLHADALRAGHRANAQLLGQKTDTWEGGHRVPFIARWPGRIPASTKGGQLLGLNDLINLSASEKEEVMARIARDFQRPPGSALRVGVGRIFSYFGRQRDRVEEDLREFLRLCLKHELPALVALDGEYWLEGRPDLWNWWRSEHPGYDPANRELVEWTSWDPADALKIAWLNWGRQLRVLPQTNLMHPRYRAACHEEMRRLVPIVLEWSRRLPPGKKDLFMGLKVGWESSVGVNKFYYPNGNALLDRPVDEDPKTGLKSTELPARGVVQIGYAAVKTAGIRSSGEITEADLAEVARWHMADLAAEAARLGVPRTHLFTHGAGWKEGELLYDAAVNEFSSPGWSFYRHAKNPAADIGVQRALAKSDAPHWAAVEWLHQGPNTAEAWRASLEATLADPRIRFLCIFNWRQIAERPAALQAIRAVGAAEATAPGG